MQILTNCSHFVLHVLSIVCPYLNCPSRSICTDFLVQRPIKEHVLGNKILSEMSRNESGRFGALKYDSTHHFFRNACTKSGSLRFSVFRLLTDFVCLYTYEFWLSLCKIVRSSVILLLPLSQRQKWPYVVFIGRSKE